jgi:hypothetical protein
MGLCLEWMLTGLVQQGEQSVRLNRDYEEWRERIAVLVRYPLAMEQELCSGYTERSLPCCPRRLYRVQYIMAHAQCPGVLLRIRAAAAAAS